MAAGWVGGMDMGLLACAPGVCSLRDGRSGAAWPMANGLVA